jgi:hypothetical protein
MAPLLPPLSAGIEGWGEVALDLEKHDGGFTTVAAGW